MAIVLAAAVMLGVICIFLGINALLRPDETIERRLEQFAGRPEAAPATPAARQESALAASLERSVGRQSFGQRLRVELARADLKLTASEFLVIRGLSTVFVALVFLLISGFNAVFGLAGLIVGYQAPMVWVRRRQAARLKAFSDQLGDTIMMMANGLRSGYSVLQAMQMVANEAPEPTASEFQRVIREIGLGLSPEEALNNLVRRINSEDLDMMVTAMNVQREVGGNLAQVLETIGETIRERVRLKGEIGALTAQGTISAYVISALPLLLAGLLYLMNREYMLSMFQFPFVVMPICALISIGIGFMVIKKIVDIKV